MTKVVLTQTQTPYFTEDDINNATKKALDKLEYDFGAKIRKIVIKPNLCYYWDYSTGETTDPRLVSAVIDWIRLKIGNDIDISVAEADASAMRTKYAFKVLGYDKLCQKKNVNLINLSQGEIRDVPITVREKNFSLPINEILLNSDLIINLPKLKTHNFVGTTCALKNMFGAISKPRKYSYHEMISHVIVGINKVVKSNIVVVDGLVAKGSYPKKLGVVLAGDDALATDFTAAKIMGFNPLKVAHLKLAAKEKIGNIKNIALIEDIKLDQLKKEFPHYNHVMHNMIMKMQIRLLKSYTKFTGDVFPPFIEK
jgi:uncharacterized protein (DUF362 family)